MVYLIPFLSYLVGSKSLSARPSDPDTMTKTAVEAIASCSGKMQICAALRTHTFPRFTIDNSGFSNNTARCKG